MKEIFSISSGLDVAKPMTLLSKGEQGNDKSSSKDFLSIMFAQIEESLASAKNSTLDLKLEIPQEKNVENVKIVSKDDSTKKSVDEHLLDDLLKVVSLLKTPENKAVTFPSFSNKIDKLINNEVAIKDLKEVKNITDLLKLSKKYDLGLEKISVKKLDTQSLQKEFPKLDKTFFDIPKKSIQKADIPITTTNKENEIKPTVLSLNNIEKPTKEIKKEPTLFEKIMSTPKQETKKEVDTLNVNKEVPKGKVADITNEDIPKVVVKEDVKKSLKVVQEDVPKVVVKEDVKKSLKVVQEDAPKVAVKEKLDIKTNKEIEEPKRTRTAEVKVETDIPKKGIVENILHTIKPEKNKTPSVIQTTLSEEKSKADSELTETKSETKIEVNQHKTELRPQIKTEITHNKPAVHTKETFNNFANEFKQKLENYKPPVMRVQMALTPKGLGDVDVTIVNRGQNLHVNITSNTNTMATFTQNQAEFKNSLVNMGFTNLEMNFSDQRERNQGQNQNSNSSNGEFSEEFSEEDTTSIELVVPQYI